jgi:hypothetical protein
VQLKLIIVLAKMVAHIESHGMGSTGWLELLNLRQGFRCMPLGDVGLQRDITTQCVLGGELKIDATEMTRSLDHACMNK